MVELAERYADGRAAQTELTQAWYGVWPSDPAPNPPAARALQHAASAARLCAAWGDARSALFQAREAAANAAGWHAVAAVPPWQLARPAWDAALAEAAEVQCHLLRDLFTPFAGPVTVAPEWLTWSGGAVPNMARAIYQEHAFDRLPVLGDALEDAGCQEEDLLSHCRSGGEHTRGCWALDLVRSFG